HVPRNQIGARVTLPRWPSQYELRVDDCCALALRLDDVPPRREITGGQWEAGKADSGEARRLERLQQLRGGVEVRLPPATDEHTGEWVAPRDEQDESPALMQTLAKR